MSRMTGFTLIEILVAVAIIAILGTVALPAYQEQVRKARRADGISLLLDIAQRQERFNTDNKTYTTNLNELDYTGDGLGVVSADQHYRAQVQTNAACGLPDCYYLVGAPLNAAQIKDGNLRLWSNGRKQRSVGAVWQESWD